MRETLCRCGLVLLATLAIMPATAPRSLAQTINERAERDEIARVPAGDADMAATMSKARATLTRFLALAEAPHPSMSGFAVKVGIRGKEDTEYFWIAPFKRQGGRFVGRLNNTPRLVTTVRSGQIISFARKDIVDWMYRDDGRMIGNHTACALVVRETPDEAAKFKKQYGLNCDADAPGPAAPYRAARLRTGGDKSDMVGWVILTNTPLLELTADTLRRSLDDLFPGQFMPARDDGSFVVDGVIKGAQFLIESRVPGAAGTFLLHNVPAPYTGFSDFAKAIKHRATRREVSRPCCWLAVDSIGDKTDDAEAYRFIGRLLVKLAPSDSAFLVHPSKLTTIAFDDQVRRRLASGELMP